MTRLRRAVGILALGPAAALAACGGDSASVEPAPATVIRTLGETGTHPGQFSYPRGIDRFDYGGREFIAVVDKTARIQLIDVEDGSVLGSVRTPKMDLGKPTGLTVGAHPLNTDRPALWVADTHEHRVLIYALPFDADSEPTEPDLMFGTYGNRDGEFIYPTDIAMIERDGSMRVFVSEYGGNDRVSEFAVDRNDEGVAFRFIRQIGISGVAMDAPENDPSALARPQSVAVRAESNELVVNDAGRHRLVRFDLETGRVAGWTDGSIDTDGLPMTAMNFPYGLWLTDDGRAIVSEFGNGFVRVIDLESGRTESVIGTAGRRAGEFATPWGCVPVRDGLAVLDSGNNRVQVVRFSGGAR